MELVQLERLILDWSLYPRNDLCGVTVRRLKDSLLTGHELPPILVCADSMRVVDGFHRVRAYKDLKRESIPVELRHFSEDAELFAHAIGANIAHGRPLDPYDIKRCIAKCLEFGIVFSTISEITRIPTPQIQEIVRGFAPSDDGSSVPLKRPLEYMKKQLGERQLSKAQVECIEGYGGRHPSWHVRQLLLLLNNDLWPTHDDSFSVLMCALCERWKDLGSSHTAP